MNDPLTAFPWPVPPGAAAPPTWRDNRFWVDGQPGTVLRYEAGDSHWTADLTTLHEAHAGSQHPIDRASRNLVVRSLSKFLPGEIAAPLILDVGCSSGFVVEAIRAAQPRARLISSDYILPPLENLAARLPGLPLLQFDLRRCPLPDACVDAVTALNVLEHIDDDRAALREIFRVLRSGGMAHIEVPAGPDVYDVYDELLMHHRRYRLGDLVEIARGTGWEVLRATHLGCLIYPAFRLVKQRGRRLLSLSDAEKQALVASQIRYTSDSVVLGAVSKVEEFLGRFVSFPFGIRCVVVLRKPPAGGPGQ